MCNSIRGVFLSIAMGLMGEKGEMGAKGLARETSVHQTPNSYTKYYRLR
jgi:hypothetical protein